MPIFKVKHTEKVIVASIYEVEAKTKEEAIEKYINELIGTLEPVNTFFTGDSEESIKFID